MGLLQKAEQRRYQLLQKLTREKRKYLDHVSKKRKSLLHHEIRKQRKVITKKIKKGKMISPQPNLVSSQPDQKITTLKQQIENRLQAMTGKMTEKSALELSIAERKEWVVSKEYLRTGIPGFDALLKEGIPRSSSLLIAGGAGSGKTIFGLQTLYQHALHGEKCLYMSFEESEEKLLKQMKLFGWDAGLLIKKGKIIIRRFNPLEIARDVDALLLKEKGDLLIEIKPFSFPKNFKPEIIVIDSLSAISSAFVGKEDSYRLYVEQLFRFFETLGATSFFVTETEQVPQKYSSSGVEEFLADGVIVLYHIKHGNIRERAVEILKLRGADHQKKIVAMEITSKGIEVFPEQEVFGGVGE